MNLVSYVDILEVVGELKDYKAKLIEGEDIAKKDGISELSITERDDGTFDISGVCKSPSEKSNEHCVCIKVISEPHSLACKCSCLDVNSGKCIHVVATLIHLHRNDNKLPSCHERKSQANSLSSSPSPEICENSLSIVKEESMDPNPGNSQSDVTCTAISSGALYVPKKNRLPVDIKESVAGSLVHDVRDTKAVLGSADKPEEMNISTDTPEVKENTSEDSDGIDRSQCGRTLRSGRGQRRRTPNPKYSLSARKFACSICLRKFDKKAHCDEHVRSHTGEKPFRCDICGQCYSQRRSLLKHKEDGGEKGCRSKLEFKCNICERHFERQALLDDHCLSHTNRRDFQCNHCEKTFAYKRGLDVHLRTHAKDINEREIQKPLDCKYVCDECGKRFQKSVHLKQHKLTHANLKPFHCAQCGKNFSRQRTLTAHKIQHKGCMDSSSVVARPRTVIKCETCGKEFLNRMHHEEHVRSHTGERPFQCVVCGKGFASKRSLRNHSHDGPSARNRPHICSQCPASFTTAFMLKTHERSHSDEKPWVCAECGKAYRSQHVFQDHQNQHRGIKAHKCKECGKAFTWRTSLWAHTRDHTKEKPYECVQCSAMFADQAELKEHWEVHLDDKPHQCPECGLGFMLEEDCKKHVETHKKEPTHLCSQCDKKFARADELSRHQQSHKEKKLCLCPNCGQTFSSKGHLKVHMLIHTGVKPFECETCQKRFYTRSLLRKHAVFHSNERPFECALCGDKFLTQGILRAHIRTHTGERPFSCTECGKSFPQSTYLKRHALTHSGERPFPCSHCESAFVSRYDLKIHMRTHTGEKPYSCDDCGERFYERAQLTSHRRIHTGERPFLCDVCGKGFNSSNHVKKHFGRVHPETAPFPCSDCGERFMMCEALRKHRKCTHLAGIERVGRLVQVAKEKEQQHQECQGQNTVVAVQEQQPSKSEKDTLNRLIEDSEILIEDQSEDSSNDIVTQRYELVQVPACTTIVNLVDSSSIQMKLSDEFDCQTVQVFHAEPIAGFDGTTTFQAVSLTQITEH